MIPVRQYTHCFTATKQTILQRGLDISFMLVGSYSGNGLWFCWYTSQFTILTMVHAKMAVNRILVRLWSNLDQDGKILSNVMASDIMVVLKLVAKSWLPNLVLYQTDEGQTSPEPMPSMGKTLSFFRRDVKYQGWGLLGQFPPFHCFFSNMNVIQRILQVLMQDRKFCLRKN